MISDFYRTLVRTTYDEAVKLHATAPSDLKVALKSHERVPQFIDNLAMEFTKVADLRSKKAQALPAVKHLKEIVYDMTDVFISGLIQENERMRESEIKKAQRLIEKQNKENLDAASTGNFKGDYADIAKEAGLTTDDSRDVL